MSSKDYDNHYEPIPRPKRGRPKASDVAEINLRILNAATQLFLNQGFSRTAQEQVAENARVSKTTLYNRFPTKEVLFDAVVQSCLDQLFEPVTSKHIQGTVESKLVKVGEVLVESTLTNYVIRLMQMVLAETLHFPRLTSDAYQRGLSEGAKSVAEVLASGDQAISENLAIEIGRRFVEMALHPLFLNALFHSDLDYLRSKSVSDIAQVSRMLAWDADQIEIDMAT